ncbi:MAG: RNA-guided endonuclease InsQ/TnpB family protein [Metallibacterium sp.]
MLIETSPSADGCKNHHGPRGRWKREVSFYSFKRKDARQSANYASQGFTFDPATRTLKLAKIGAVRVRWSRAVIPTPSSVRVIRAASGKYFVSLVVDVALVELPKTGQSVGIDFGVVRLATLSNGERIANPTHGAKWARRLAFYQCQLARKPKAKKGERASRRRMQASQRVARVHERIRNARMDTLHKLSTDLVRRFDRIVVEDLNLRGMVKNHHLARAVSDASIGTAIRLLEEKAERAGKTVVKIDRWYPSSKTCSHCGHIVEKLPLSIRNWACPQCSTRHDRDENAAQNILAVGHTVPAHGGTV